MADRTRELRSGAQNAGRASEPQRDRRARGAAVPPASLPRQRPHGHMRRDGWSPGFTGEGPFASGVVLTAPTPHA